jgi:hypothetical protein
MKVKAYIHLISILNYFIFFPEGNIYTAMSPGPYPWKAHPLNNCILKLNVLFIMIF